VASPRDHRRTLSPSGLRSWRSSELYCRRHMVPWVRSRCRVLKECKQVDPVNTVHSYDPYGDQAMQDAAAWMPQRKWISNNPIFETTNTSLSCNTPGTPARAYIPIRAGENLTAVYSYWVHTVGPMIAWMAYCDNAENDCATFASETADWFKIGEKGLLEGSIETGEWFQKAFSMWDGSPSLWSETVPVGLKTGRYLVRHEIISLHSANSTSKVPSSSCSFPNMREGATR